MKAKLYQIRGTPTSRHDIHGTPTSHHDTHGTPTSPHHHIYGVSSAYHLHHRFELPATTDAYQRTTSETLPLQRLDVFQRLLRILVDSGGLFDQ